MLVVCLRYVVTVGYLLLMYHFRRRSLLII